VVQRRIASHKSFDSTKIVAVNGLFELPDLLCRFDVSFEFGPACKPIETRDLKLRLSERFCASRFQQVLGLVF
jgi:hypothetical protein